MRKCCRLNSTAQTDGVKQYSGGAMFVPVNGSTTMLLKEWKAAGMDASQDKIQFLKVEDATKDKAFTFVDRAFIIKEFDLDPVEDKETIDEYEAMFAGWWVAGKWGEEGYEANEEPVSVGKGFLTLNMSLQNVSFQYAGEAPQEATPVEYQGKNPMICNYIPREVRITELTCENMDASQDKFQRLRTNNATTLESYTFVDRAFIIKEFDLDPVEDKETIDEYEEMFAGWWMGGKWGEEGYEVETRAQKKVLDAGEGLLGLVMSGNKIKVWFPSSIPAAE